MKKLRIAIVEPSYIVSRGLAAIIAEGAEFEVVYVAQSMRQVVERMALIAPDVVIVGSQVESAANLRQVYSELQQVTLLSLSLTVRDEDYMRQFDGEINLYDSPSQVLRRLRQALQSRDANPYNHSHDLSEREQDVLVLVAKGMANKEIADRLNISVHTVISHRKNIAHKTGIKSVAGLTVYALLNNLLEQGDVVM